MFDLKGKVALITGAARGQGRSHALRLAEAGASIIGIDICRQIDTVPYAMGTRDDLDRTAEEVRAQGGRVLTLEADVRSSADLDAAVREAVREFGGIDIVVANAGTVNGIAPMWELSDEQFRDQLDVNLTGVWRTIKATVPQLIRQQRGGSIILISSISGIVAELNVGHYSASKHGGEWPDADAGSRTGPPALHSGQQRQPDERQHADDRQRGLQSSLLRGQRGCHPEGFAICAARNERASRALRRTRGHQQRDHLPRVGGGSLRHRHDSRRRCRRDRAVQGASALTQRPIAAPG